MSEDATRGGTEDLDNLLERLDVPSFIDRAKEASLARGLAGEESEATGQPAANRLPRYAFVYETRALASYSDYARNLDVRELADRVKMAFDRAYDSWNAISTLGLVGASTADTVSPRGLDEIAAELSGEPLQPELTLAFRMAVAGTAARRTADVRHDLSRFVLTTTAEDDSNWRERVITRVFAAYVLLTRKANGWSDIDAAITAVEELRAGQQQFEAQYLDAVGNVIEQATAAYELVGLYHLAQMITLTANYLVRGDVGITATRERLDSHHEQAIAAFGVGPWQLLSHLARLLWVGCRELARNAIWTHAGSAGERTHQFAQLLCQRGRPNPVIELWPSQQDALDRGLLDSYRRAILVEMPTSAGKTLLAKFVALQTLSLNPEGVIAYIVPTRALVNQVTMDLRTDFRELDVRVEQSVPAFELDPMEEQLLSAAPNVLVSTPEKFDLLVRRGHPATQNVSLVIVDEAHNLQDANRGPRLELLLAMIKRERPGARFLMLSPFLPNDRELVTWLGEDRALPPISVDWRPGRKLVGALELEGRAESRRLIFETLPAADNTDVAPGKRISLAKRRPNRTIAAISHEATLATLDRGSVLILCKGPGTAVKRADGLANVLPTIPSTPRLQAVRHYVESELGSDATLSRCLAHGVAYHHSGLSQETRWLVELLIRSGEVKVVCGTTTLAQGVNFPITTVIVETLKKGDADLTYSDFWNIAGRAGRALVDKLGVVAFPAPTHEKKDELIEFLRGEAQDISSQLATLIDHADQLTTFSLRDVRTTPAFSSLLQFLAHALRVSGSGRFAEEVEDLLRASLVYHQARRESSERAARLVALCRAYLQSLGNSTGVLGLADQTGFATPSVFHLLARRDEFREMTKRASWEPSNLFGQDLTQLTQCVSAIGDLPEIRLGEGQGRPFSPERVASILRDWVGGAPLETLAVRYGRAEKSPENQVTDFAKYLYSTLLAQTSWGLGALETLYLPSDERETGEVGYVPSMVYFGVSKPEAVWLRMVGVPRLAADGLADVWRSANLPAPSSYDTLRQWVTGLSSDEWGSAIPSGSAVTVDDMRLIWSEFVG
jgi:replicative superfamily II helicase